MTSALPGPGETFGLIVRNYRSCRAPRYGALDFLHAHLSEQRAERHGTAFAWQSFGTEPSPGAADDCRTRGAVKARAERCGVRVGLRRCVLSGLALVGEHLRRVSVHRQFGRDRSCATIAARISG